MVTRLERWQRVFRGNPGYRARRAQIGPSGDDIGYDAAVLIDLAHRRRTFRGLSALALLAWFGLVMMGIAHAAPAPTASAQHATSAPATAHASHHAAAAASDGTPDTGCGMTFGCHCGTSCYGAIVPFAPIFARTDCAGETYAPGVQPVPPGRGEPPLHPPSS
ncbi:hypothetical protein [Oleiagrimonas sp. C23AA]|uniref:hypothetical protein n=1 Tax=Oleiagrimonas sp. C23AA TaxID=2719047 RepID=UPI00141E4232|nr:hypothetical protein [Oleiagrimonas sp. C23AA]NII11187.1 hypothetical protein [Oleiagrimonas sp. C23AA]